MKTKITLIERLDEAYDKAKKPIAYLIIISIFSLELISKFSIIPTDIKHEMELTLMVALAMIIMEILFRIYEKVVADKGHLKIIQPNDLYGEILSLVKTGKKVNIACIGVAGRFGWYSVISRLLDKNNDDSLHEANEFTLDIALISPDFLNTNKNILEKFDVLLPVTEDIKRAQKRLMELYPTDDKKQLNLYHYDYLPNFVGFLVNENYLFLNICYWEKLENSTLNFRASGTEYLVYDLNDEFGGARYIERFLGWFEYIKKDKI